VTLEQWGFLANCRYWLQDQDSQFSQGFCQIIESTGIKALWLPVPSPPLTADAERWVRSAKEEGVSRLLLFGQSSLKRALQQ
jgi:putative transposase